MQRLYGRLLDTLLATWGIGIILQQVIRLTFGPELQNVSVPGFLTGEYTIGGVSIQSYRLAVFLVATTLLAIVLLILYRTDFGTRLRAVTQNPQISACNGIDVNQVRSYTFALGAGLAGVAGVMVSGFNAVSPTMGTNYVVDSFIVVVVGGVSSLIGTVASSALLGSVNSMGGRDSLIGAAVGAIAINAIQNALSENESLINIWRLLLGILFLLVVMFLPRGLASLSSLMLKRSRVSRSDAAATAIAESVEKSLNMSQVEPRK